jgi:hypothetical protein
MHQLPKSAADSFAVSAFLDAEDEVTVHGTVLMCNLSSIADDSGYNRFASMDPATVEPPAA